VGSVRSRRVVIFPNTVLQLPAGIQKGNVMPIDLSLATDLVYGNLTVCEHYGEHPDDLPKENEFMIDDVFCSHEVVVDRQPPIAFQGYAVRMPDSVQLMQSDVFESIRQTYVPDHGQSLDDVYDSYLCDYTRYDMYVARVGESDTFQLVIVKYEVEGFSKYRVYENTDDVWKFEKEWNGAYALWLRIAACAMLDPLLFHKRI